MAVTYSHATFLCPSCGKRSRKPVDCVRCEHCGWPDNKQEDKPKRNKYNAVKKEIDGIVFDSSKEARRYLELKVLQAAGKIANLELQPEYDLVVCKYRGDFRYQENGVTVVEDVKSKATKTRVYRIKNKLMKERFGIDIREV